MSNLDQIAIGSIKRILQNESGLIFENARNTILEKKISRRLNFLNLSNYTDYLMLLNSSINKNNSEEIEHIISELTVNETSFFRDQLQFDFFNTKIIPEYVHKENINILSMACSTGEEPFSIVMCLLENMNSIENKNIKITACDIDHKVLKESLNMKYPKDSQRIRNVSPIILNKYFKKIDEYYIVSERVKKHVDFIHLNIIKDDLPQKYDIIFCKNVMMYFDEERKTKLIKKICDSLKSNGYFFIGITERLNSIPSCLEKINLQGGVIYKKKKSNPKVSNSFKENAYSKTSSIKIQNNLSQQSKIVKQYNNDYGFKKINFKGIIDKNNKSEYEDVIKKLNILLDNPSKNFILDLEKVKLIERNAAENISKTIQYINRKGGNCSILLSAGKLKDFLIRMNLDAFVNFYSNIEEIHDYHYKQDVKNR